ncbi:MAG TPA: hypothetical protein VHW00_04605 [Thermoanaerobaculia bacterium]|nr:hypothetical protein [Thermoanaerobaculia bacterium]
MGIALWLSCGALAFGLARIIPAGRRKAWSGELLAALLCAFACGLAANALDFGGWKELDWRAALFTFFGAFAAAGLVRVLTIRNGAATMRQ